MAADVRLEHRLDDSRAEQVVLRWLEIAEAVGEDAEGTVDVFINHDLLANDRLLLPVS